MPLAFCCTDSGAAVFRATNSGCYEPNPVQRDLDSCRFSPLPDRSGRKLVVDRDGTTRGSFPTDYAPVGCVTRQTHPPKMKPCRERPMCRSVSGECYLLTVVKHHTRVPRFLPPIGREVALCKVLAPPAKSQKLPCTATADPKTRKIYSHQPAVAVQGSSGR